MKKMLVAAALLCGFVLADEQPEMKVHDMKTLADFSQRNALSLLVLDEGMSVDRRAGTVTVPARSETQVTLWTARPDSVLEHPGGGAYAELRIRLESTAEGLVNTAWRVHDADGRASAQYVLDPGINVIRIPLRNLFHDGRKSILDPLGIKSVALAFGRMQEPFVFRPVSVDLVWSAARLPAATVFDFGNDYALWPGAIPVDASTAYSDERGYGLTTPDAQHKVHIEPFTLFGDGVQAGEVGFAMKVDPGEYEVRAVAFHRSWDGVRDNANYSIDAEGAEVYSSGFDIRSFLSFDHHYYGADVFYDPRKPVVEQYFGEYFKPHAFAVTVEDGRLDLLFHNAAVFAVMIWPAGTKGQEAVDALYRDCFFDVWKKHLRVRNIPAMPVPPGTKEEILAGWVDVQDRLSPLDYPVDLPAETVVSCAPGQTTCASFVFRPVGQMNEISGISVKSLEAKDGPCPARVTVSIAKEHLLQKNGPYHETVPTLLVPDRPLPAVPGWLRRYWLTITVPEEAKPGAYKMSVLVNVPKAVAAELALDLTVPPVKLAAPGASFGMWNNGATGAHQLGAFGGDEQITRAVIDAEIADQAAHGLTGYAFHEPYPSRLDDEGLPVMDFSHNTLIADTMKKYGMGEHESIMGIIGAVNYRLMRWGIEEFSPEFNKAYKQMLRNIADWAAEKDINVIVYLVDEPRENNIQPWNRNRVDCIRYLRMAREVPGVKTTITLMGDRDGFGDDYTPMVPLMDVVMTHAWERSRQIMLLSAKEHITKGIPYNNGWSRYVWGFYVWRSGTSGNWQWVYSWENSHAWLPLFNSGEASAVFVYPEGYAPTVKYEWVREGITDYRYIRTLQQAISSAPDAEASVAAKAFLEQLKAFLPEYPHTGLKSGADAGGTSPDALSRHCDAWRYQITEFISAITEDRKPVLMPQATAMFPRALQAYEKSYTVNWVRRAPVIDGSIDDRSWQDVPAASAFVSIPRAEKASVETEVRIVTDGRKLYFAFHCVEPNYGEFKAYAMERDGAVWEDDAVEIFLDTDLDAKTYYQVLVNTLGTVLDSFSRDSLWNGDVQAAASKGKGFWDVEIAVDLASINAKPKPGDTWGMNLCRDRWAGRSENSSWAFVGASFHNPEGFGKLVFGER
ncbi:MAG: carbohydrate-binding family 9-like protein [Planctomycetes bacterium]|nr:carbohydrate-binding family 9-like protein [Planctomycetota bacterium]